MFFEERKKEIKYAVYFRKLNNSGCYWFGDDSKLHIVKGKARIFCSSEDAYVVVSRFLMLLNLTKENNDLCDFHVVVSHYE